MLKLQSLSYLWLKIDNLLRISKAEIYFINWEVLPWHWNNTILWVSGKHLNYLKLAGCLYKKWENLGISHLTPLPSTSAFPLRQRGSIKYLSWVRETQFLYHVQSMSRVRLPGQTQSVTVLYLKDSVLACQRTHRILSHLSNCEPEMDKEVPAFLFHCCLVLDITCQHDIYILKFQWDS